MFKIQSRWVSFGGRALAAVALMTTGGFLLQAQTIATSGTPAIQGVSAQEPIFHLQTPDLRSDADGQAYSSSSDSSGLSESDDSKTQIASNTEAPFHFFNAMQYGGGRQRYGRPKYRGGNTNADGSPKYNFFVGGGFGVPVGSFDYATTGWGFGGGGGRMFNAHVGVNLEFNFDRFGMSQTTLNNQQALYNYAINLYNQQNPSNPVSPISGLGGNNRVWSFTLQPIENLKTGEGIGAYVTGGVGFYHKVANFTVPTIGTYCDPFFGCYAFTANQVIDHYTSNAFGLNGAFGVTYKFSKFSPERLYAEVRVVHMFNSYRPGVTIDNVTPQNAGEANFFPQNSQETTYLPIKFGLRF